MFMIYMCFTYCFIDCLYICHLVIQGENIFTFTQQSITSKILELQFPLLRFVREGLACLEFANLLAVRKGFIKIKI